MPPPPKLPFGPPPPGLDQRLLDWKPRLIALVRRRRLEPYRYGVFDCCIFAGEAVEAVTGVALLPGVERPKGWMGSARFLMRHGLTDVDELVSAALGQLPGDPENAQEGDLVTFHAGGELHLAVRIGDGAVAPGPAQLEVWETPHWKGACWAIGREP